MAKRDKYYLIGKFENDDVPTGTDFSDFISSSLNLHQTESYQILSSSLHISGTLSASGDLWVSGNIEAQSYTLNNLAFVDTNTINTTGSVIFGDSASLDVHRITGSLFLSGATAQFTSTNTNFLNSVNIGTTSSPQGKLGGGLTVSNSLTMGTTPHHQSQSISSSILITGSNVFGHLAMDTNEILHWNDNLTIGSYGGGKASKGNIKFLTSMGVDSDATSNVRVFISASGFVGIGTDAPTDTAPTLNHLIKLEVSGGIVKLKNSGSHISSSTGITASNATLDLYNPSQEDITGKGSIITFTDHYNGGPNKCVRAAIKGGTDTAGNNAEGFLSFHTSDNDASDGAVEEMRITNTGKVGIGTSSPLEKLHVEGNISASGTLNTSASHAPTHHAGILAIVYDTGSAQFHYTGSYGAGGGGEDGIFKETGSFYATTNNIEITGSLKANGDVNFPDNLSIGLADNTEHKFHVKTATAFPALFENTATGMGIQFKDGATSKTMGIGVNGNNLQLLTDNIVRLQIDDSGKVGIGRTPQIYKLEVQGDMAATSDVIAYMGSDRRLKDNIKPITNPIEKIKQIGGYTFDWNDNQTTYEGSDVGVIAQEIEAVLPSLVQDREDGYKGVKYDKIVSLLIEGIKDQQNQIDDLKDQINNLKS